MLVKALYHDSRSTIKSTNVVLCFQVNTKRLFIIGTLLRHKNVSSNENYGLPGTLKVIIEAVPITEPDPCIAFDIQRTFTKWICM